MCETDLTPFEKSIYRNLLAAQVKLHTPVDRLVKYECLYSILSCCRNLRLDPVPYLKAPVAGVIHQVDTVFVQQDYFRKCPHCGWETDKGEMSMRAHVGRVHKGVSSNKQTAHG